MATLSGADAGFRVGGGTSGVSRISARWGCLRSGPIRKVGGGGGSPLQVRYTKRGGGTVHFRTHTKSGRGGGQSTSGPIRKVGGGGGGHTENIIYMYLPMYYLGILHMCARMNLKYMPAKVNLL